MQVVRQHANRNGLEWIPLLDRCIYTSQAIDVPQEKVTRSVRERDGEEEGAAGNLCSAVSRHDAIMFITFCTKSRGHGAQERAFAHPTGLC
jgi:hypothetical protein